MNAPVESVSERSQPGPVPLPGGFAHELRVHRGLVAGIQVTCTCTDNGKPWSRTLDSGHTIDDLVRFAAMHEGPGQPGENKGEPDGLVGPGPVTDSSSPSSPPAEACYACGASGGDLVFIGVAEVLPDGSTGTVHLYCRDIAPCNDRCGAQLLSFGSTLPRPANETPFGSESEPGGAS